MGDSEASYVYVDRRKNVRRTRRNEGPVPARLLFRMVTFRRFDVGLGALSNGSPPVCRSPAAISAGSRRRGAGGFSPSVPNQKPGSASVPARVSVHDGKEPGDRSPSERVRSRRGVTRRRVRGPDRRSGRRAGRTDSRCSAHGASPASHSLAAAALQAGLCVAKVPPSQLPKHCRTDGNIGKNRGEALGQGHGAVPPVCARRRTGAVRGCRGSRAIPANARRWGALVERRSFRNDRRLRRVT